MLWKHGRQVGTHCTSGFDTIGRRTGNTYMLTAGHCFGLGVRVDTNRSNPRTMGSITNRKYANYGLDAETVGGGYGPYIWRHGAYVATVIGSGDVPPNEGNYSLVTINGAVTGEHRKIPVVADDWCVTYSGDGHIACYLEKASGFAVKPGDSGGPVYQYSSSGRPEVFAAGIIAAHGWNTTFFTQIIDIENQFNVNIATG